MGVLTRRDIIGAYDKSVIKQSLNLCSAGRRSGVCRLSGSDRCNVVFVFDFQDAALQEIAGDFVVFGPVSAVKV